MKLFDVAANNAGIDEEKAIEYMEKLVTKYGDIYTGMMEISDKKENALKGLRFPKKFCEELVKIASENMKKPEVALNYMCYLTVYEPNGIEVIKKTFTIKKVPKGYKFKITYFGAPKYRLSFIGPDYKSVDKFATNFFKELEKNVSKYRSEFSYEQIKKPK